MNTVTIGRSKKIKQMDSMNNVRMDFSTTIKKARTNSERMTKRD